MNRFFIFATVLLALISGQLLRAVSSTPQSEKSDPKQTTKPRQSTQPDGDELFNTHCARCHTPPMSISPRITGTVIMHMRARARLSREDEIQLLKYMAP